MRQWTQVEVLLRPFGSCCECKVMFIGMTPLREWTLFIQMMLLRVQRAFYSDDATASAKGSGSFSFG